MQKLYFSFRVKFHKMLFTAKRAKSFQLQVCSLFTLDLWFSKCVFDTPFFFHHLDNFFFFFLYQKPLILSCFSILHGTPAFQRVLPLAPLLLPKRNVGQVWERDCPSEVGCYQQGAACLQFRSALATEEDLKASHNVSCDPSKHAC